MMRNKLTPLAGLSILALLGFASAAIAQNPMQYTWAELNYLDGEIRDVDLDGDGYRLAGSFGFAENFYVQGSFTDIDFDGSIDGEEWRIGLGAHTAFNENTDGFLELDYVDQDINIGGCCSTDESTWAFAGGLRALPVDWFEWRWAVTILGKNVVSGDAELGADLTFRWHMAIGLSASVGFQWTQEKENWILGLRWGF